MRFSKALGGLRLEHLWAIVVVCAAGGFISTIPTSPHDFWWHLKAGELIASGDFPRTNRFSWALPADTRYIYQSWLSELLFAWLNQIGGFQLVIFLRNLMASIMFGLVAWETRERSGSWRLGALAVAFAAFMSFNNFTTRPQIWSWLPFMAIFMLLSRYSEGRLAPRWLMALPLIMVFWVNAHGAFMLGLVLIGAFVVGETLRRMLRQSRALSWERLRWLFGVAILCGAAIMINPLGWNIFGYVRLLLTDPSSQTWVLEWQPPSPRNPAGAAFYLGVIGVIVASSLGRRRPTITELLLVCGFAWQAFNGVRYVIWFGLIAMPIAASWLAAQRPIFTTQPAEQPNRGPVGNSRSNALAASIPLGMFILFQPWIQPMLPLPEKYRELYADMPNAQNLFSDATPVAATEHLREQPCEGRLLAEMGYASYMIWALPNQPTFVDPRVELFPSEMWEDYRALLQGRNVDAVFDKYQVACLAVDSSTQEELFNILGSHPGWEQSFADARSSIWRRVP